LTNYALRKYTGAGKRLKQAVLALADAGLKVEYVTLQPPDAQHENINYNILSEPHLPAGSAPNHQSPLFWIKYILNASKACREKACQQDTVCLMAFTIGGALPLIRAAGASGKPLIIFVRSDETNELSIKGTSPLWRWLFRILESRAVRAAHTMVFQTENQASTFLARYGAVIADKVKILHNNLPPSQNPSSELKNIMGDDDGFIFTTSSKLNDIKNIDTIIEAMSELKNTKARLLIIGDGPGLKKLKAKAEHLGVSSIVKFSGWRDDAPQLVAASDVFILASLTEGMSNSMLEALSSDRPCLLSDIPAHRELFPDASVRFDPKDHKQLAERMRMAIEDEKFMSQLKEAGCATKEKLSFDWDKKLVSIIENIINEK